MESERFDVTAPHRQKLILTAVYSVRFRDVSRRRFACFHVSCVEQVMNGFYDMRPDTSPWWGAERGAWLSSSKI
jgi:hypothetical protein